MHHSTDRILTTHVGSLPRSKAVTDVLFSRERDDAADPEMGAPVIAAAVAEVVRRQVAVGIDVVSGSATLPTSPGASPDLPAIRLGSLVRIWWSFRVF